jgi:hypothetical protein
MFETFFEKREHAMPLYSQLSPDLEDQASQASSDRPLRSSKPLNHSGNDRGSLYTSSLSSCWRLLFFILTVLNLILLFANLRWQMNKDKFCMESNAVWSPVWEDVSPGYSSVRFNGTLDAPSEFRGPPSPAVDEAWSQLDDGMLVFTLNTPKLEWNAG